MPAVTSLRMYTAVAALAQRDQVVPRVCTALGKRYDVMHLLDRHHDPTLKTLLTKRMLICIGCTDTAPSPSVPTAYSRIPVVLLVAGILLFLMLLAVSSVCQVGTARPRTWSLRFIRHLPTSIHNKSPTGFRTCEARIILLFAIITIS